MSVSSNRSIFIKMAGEVIFSGQFAATENTAAPGAINIYSLILGANTITVPVGFTVKGATIVPPAGNTVALTLKGVAGDTGIVISSTDPTSIGFETAPANFVINASAALDGLRIVWN